MLCFQSWWVIVLNNHHFNNDHNNDVIIVFSFFRIEQFGKADINMRTVSDDLVMSMVNVGFRFDHTSNDRENISVQILITFFQKTQNIDCVHFTSRQWSAPDFHLVVFTQVSLLQVVVPRLLPPYTLRLQTALPGTAVHEHHPPTQTVALQRVSGRWTEAGRLWVRGSQ